MFDLGYSDVAPEAELSNIPFNAGDIAGSGGGGWWSDLASSPVGKFASNVVDVGGKIIGSPGDPKTGAGSSGILGGVTDLGRFAKGVLPAVQIGSAVGGYISSRDAAAAAKEQAKNQRTAQQQQLGASGPLATYGSNVLTRAEAGRLDPATEAQIDQWLQAEIQRIQQDFASRGQSGEGLAQAINAAKLRALAMRASAVQQEASGGVAALTGAAGAAGGVTQSAQQQQVTMEQLIAEANKTLAALSGSAGGGRGD